ncbi:unnamed protein product [Clavelina lepadiformis]|uniref:Uncharacterized protein n=1 Tax=Clavelina lepadiformis TaxID=159417 RepID=A0ABP0F436_CLALP
MPSLTVMTEVSELFDFTLGEIGIQVGAFNMIPAIAIISFYPPGSCDVWLSYVGGYSAIIAIFPFGFPLKVIPIRKRSVYQKALSFLDLHRCHKPNMNHNFLSSQNALPLSNDAKLQDIESEEETRQDDDLFQLRALCDSLKKEKLKHKKRKIPNTGCLLMKMLLLATLDVHKSNLGLFIIGVVPLVVLAELQGLAQDSTWSTEHAIKVKEIAAMVVEFYSGNFR